MQAGDTLAVPHLYAAADGHPEAEVRVSPAQHNTAGNNTLQSTLEIPDIWNLTHLDAATDGHAQGKVHLVFGRDKHGRDVLARIARNGQHDETQEAAGEAPGAADLRQQWQYNLQQIRMLGGRCSSSSSSTMEPESRG